MNATIYFALSTEGQQDALRRGLPAQVRQREGIFMMAESRT